MDAWLIFVTGLLSSFHCVGMCGAIVVAYSTQPHLAEVKPQAHGIAIAVRAGIFASLPSHLVYNFGRVLSYTMLGGLIGVVGGTLGSIQQVGNYVSTIGGVAMVIAGVWLLRIIPLGVSASNKPGLLRRLHLKTIGKLLTLQSLESKFYIGLFTPFLPCGLLYVMFIKAAAAGSFAAGAMTMLLFGLGIVPALVLTGLVSSFMGVKLRAIGDKLAAVTIGLMGVIMILRGLNVDLPWLHWLHEGPQHIPEGSPQPMHHH
jgi:sulfite exporter TauE/SafE